MRKGSCKFAHSLMELRPIPKGWTTAKGHYWEQGKPLPDQEVLELIEQYAALSSQLPEWVTDLRAHTKEGPPQKRARREEDKEWWGGRRQRRRSRRRTGRQCSRRTGRAKSRRRLRVITRFFVDWVEPELDERMAFLILAMKAILGYTALAWPTSRNIYAGGMLLKDLRIGFCLCGADELRHADWNLKSYGPAIITVQCGSGQWATGLPSCGPDLHFDLSPWSLYKGKCNRGRMP